MSHFNITCPEDYQKYFHVNEQGHVWLDGRNNPIPLTQNLPKRINSYHHRHSGQVDTQGLVSIQKTPHPRRVALTTAQATLKPHPP